MSLLIAFRTDLSSPKLPSWVMSRKVHSCGACVRTASSVHMSVWVLKTACVFLLLFGVLYRLELNLDQSAAVINVGRHATLLWLYFTSYSGRSLKHKCITIPSSQLHNNLITLQTGKICFTNPALLH